MKKFEPVVNNECHIVAESMLENLSKDVSFLNINYIGNAIKEVPTMLGTAITNCVTLKYSL